MNSRDQVLIRSDRHCETMVRVRSAQSRTVFTRCGKYAEDVHHKLTRSRGGDVLDQVEETYHLINLCHGHHMWIHNNIGLATLGGLYLEGQVWLESNQVIYSGPDPYLLQHYGRRTHDEVRQLGSAVHRPPDPGHVRRLHQRAS